MKIVSLKCQYISKLHICHITEDYICKNFSQKSYQATKLCVVCMMWETVQWVIVSNSMYRPQSSHRVCGCKCKVDKQKYSHKLHTLHLVMQEWLFKCQMRSWRIWEMRWGWKFIRISRYYIAAGWLWLQASVLVLFASKECQYQL